MRINARLDDSYEEKIEYLRQATGLSASDLVRESLERYYVEIRAEAERRHDALDELVGAFDGRDDTPTDLAAQYKRYLHEGLHDNPDSATVEQ
jgi:Arc/MetJ-type ribon-helix-helix transcriptional regulator